MVSNDFSASSREDDFASVLLIIDSSASGKSSLRYQNLSPSVSELIVSDVLPMLTGRDSNGTFLQVLITQALNNTLKDTNHHSYTLNETQVWYITRPIRNAAVKVMRGV